MNPPKSIALVNLPLNVPCLSIICSCISSSISPVSESFTLSANSWAISQRAFDGINSFTFPKPLRYSTVSKYGAGPSCVWILTLIFGIFMMLLVK